MIKIFLMVVMVNYVNAEESNLVDDEEPKVWTTWSKWSGCSVTCGVGHLKRTRFCLVGGCGPEEKQSQLRTCTFPACETRTERRAKIWDSWGKWSCCSKTCGRGKMTRWRHCVSGGCFMGEKEAQIKACQYKLCR